MPSTNRRSKLTAAAVVATAAMCGTSSCSTSTVVGVEAFSPVVSRTHGASMSMTNNKAAASALRMSTTDDEVAKLRAAAQKAREEAQALAKAMGKDLDTIDKPNGPEAPPVKDISNEEVATISTSIDFEGGDAASQTARLDKLVQSGDFTLWKSAVSGINPLRTYPVSLDFLSSRTGDQITGESLGISGEMDVSLDDFKDATIAVTLGSTILAIGSLAVLPPNIGATFCYLFALIPVGFIAVGSTAPGIIAAAIASTQGTADDQAKREDRICRHEAGHMLCGYLCGLPVKNYEITDTGFPCVEFFPAGEGDATGRELSQEEIAALSVVAMSGSVAEALSLGDAKGGENDLLELQSLFQRSKEFIGAAKQQELTRWGALTAYQLINANKDKYEALVEAFKAKKSVSECVAVIEGRA